MFHEDIYFFPVICMEDRIGNFEVGKEFDALLVDVATMGTPLDIFPEVRLNKHGSYR